MKVLIDSRDTPFTIDTYGMFNGENAEEMERDFIAQEYGLDPYKIEFDYDHPAIVKALANKSVSEIEDIIDRDIVKSISFPIKTFSPQFYNYTTDSYTATWDINKDKLLEAIKDLKVEDQTFADFQINTSWGEQDSDSEDYIVCALDFWAQQYKEEYEDHMLEVEYECWSEGMKPDANTQADIDKALEKQREEGNG